MAQLDGRCLCGSVSYSSTAEPAMTAICHCKDCQRQAGTALSILVGIPRDALDIQGELTTYVTVGEDHGQENQRQFCGRCGSPVLTTSNAMPDLAFIKAGTLDDTSWLQPQLEVWTSSAQPWMPSVADEAQRMERGPEG